MAISIRSTALSADRLVAQLDKRVHAGLSRALRDVANGRSMPLRTHLLLLVLAITLPLLAFGGFLLNHLAKRDRLQDDERLHQTVASVAADIDRQLQAYAVSLRSLATSRYLDQGQLDEFHSQAQRALGGQLRLVLRDAEGKELLNTGKPPPAGASANAPPVDALAIGALQVSNLILRPGEQPRLDVAVPLSTVQGLRYNLAIEFSPDVLRDILQAQRLPQGWVSGLSDAKSVVIARSIDHRRFVGTPLPAALQSHRHEADVFPTVNLSGVPVYRAVTPVKDAGWMVAATVPISEVNRAARGALMNLLVIGALLVGMSAALATILARRIADHIAILADADKTELAGKTLSASPVGPVSEINAVARALAIEAERRTEHEARIEQQRNFLSLVLTAVPSVVYIYDKQARRTLFSSGDMNAVLGYEPSDTETVEDSLARLVNPDDRRAIGEHHRALASVPDGESRNIEYRMRHKDGTWHWFMSIDRPWRRDTAGELVEIIGVAVDITTRKTMESDLALHASVTKAAHDALIAVDREGRIEAWNQGAERMFGYTAAEIIGQPIDILSPPEQRAEQSHLLSEVLAGHVVQPTDVVRRRKDGTPLAVSLSISPVVAAGGSIIGAVKAAQDVSERKRLEERQALLAKELVHRGKNQLAVVSSIVRATMRSTPDPKAFADALSGRLQSLAAAQDILVAQHWECAALMDIARAQLTPHAGDDLSRISLSGPEVILPAEFAVPIGLALHELGTNAAKYGALSAPNGRVELSWSAIRESGAATMLGLTWREIGGPLVHPPSRKGFGSTLIDQGIPGAKVVRDFAPGGLVCTIQVCVTAPGESHATQSLPRAS